MQLSIAYAAALRPHVSEHLAATALARSALQLAVAARATRAQAHLALTSSEQAIQASEAGDRAHLLDSGSTDAAESDKGPPDESS